MSVLQQVRRSACGMGPYIIRNTGLIRFVNGIEQGGPMLVCLTRLYYDACECGKCYPPRVQEDQPHWQTADCWVANPETKSVDFGLGDMVLMNATWLSAENGTEPIPVRFNKLELTVELSEEWVK